MMSTSSGRRHALSYVLRLWQISDGERAVWRAALQDVRTGERIGFPDLDAAWRYLRAQTGREHEPAATGAGEVIM